MTTYRLNLKHEKILSTVSELNTDSISSRQKLKGRFLENEKFQMSSYIKDLENTIAINKSIISSLLSDNKNGTVPKESAEALNTENLKLQNQVKNLTVNRDSLQSKLLIAEQIIEEYRGKELAYENQINEKVQELLEQLNKKEYVAQSYERKFNKLLPAIKKYASVDSEVANLVRNLNVHIMDNQKITNLVERNEMLATEVKTARGKMAELESKLTEVTTKRKPDKEYQSRLKDQERRFPHRVTQPRGFNFQQDDVQKLLSENKLLKQKIDDLMEENELIKETLKAGCTRPAFTDLSRQNHI